MILTGDGRRVLAEDYGVDSYDSVVAAHNELHVRIKTKFGETFPDLVAAHAVLCQRFEEKFQLGTETVMTTEKQRSPNEIELKFLVDISNVPLDTILEGVEKKDIRQGYLAIGVDGSETRVRDTNSNKFELTVKSPGMIERREQTSQITQEMFESLYAQTEGRRVEKTRYLIPDRTNLIELDIYKGHLDGLVTAEIEFDGRPAEAMVKVATYEPPEWLGKNVSEDPRYKNHNLSMQRPHELTPFWEKRF